MQQKTTSQIKALPLPLCNDYIVQSTGLQHPHFHNTALSWRATAEAGQCTMARLHGLQWKRISYKKAFVPLQWILVVLLIAPCYYIYLTTYILTFWVYGGKKWEKPKWWYTWTQHPVAASEGFISKTQGALSELVAPTLRPWPGWSVWRFRAYGVGMRAPSRLIRVTTEQSYRFPNTKCRQLLLAFPCMFYFK